MAPLEEREQPLRFRLVVGQCQRGGRNAGRHRLTRLAVVGGGRHHELDVGRYLRHDLACPTHQLVEHACRIVPAIGGRHPHLGLGMRLQVHAGNHAEEPRAAAARRPPEIAVLRRIGSNQLAVCGHHVDRQNLSRAIAPQPGIPAEAAVHAEAADAGRGVMCGGHDQVVLLQLSVEHRSDHRGTGPYRPGRRIDLDRLHACKVNQHHAVADVRRRPAVPARARCHPQPVRFRELHGSDHVLVARRLDDRLWIALGLVGAIGGVAARGLVCRVAAPVDRPLDRIVERLLVGRGERVSLAVASGQCGNSTCRGQSLQHCAAFDRAHPPLPLIL